MPAPGSLVTVNCIIRAGNSLSAAADLSGGYPVYIITPPDWNYAGGLTMQLSVDGTNFYDAFLINGKEHITGALTANAIVPTSAKVAEYAVAMKLRSGPRDAPVVQKADRLFKVVLTTTVGPAAAEDE